MTAYTVAAGRVAAHAKTCVATTADSVTFADDCQQVEIVSDGAAALYVTVDGSTATVGSASAFLLPAGAASSRVIPVTFSAPGADGTVVSLISAGTPTYSVTRAS